MRILIALVLVAAAGWSAYWVVGSRLLRQAIEDGIVTLEARGVEVETEGLRVTGFPNRFDTMVEAPRIAWPSGTAWRAPFLQVFALSYRPNQVIVAFPETQLVETPAGTARIAAARARASATFRTDADRALDHASLVADEVTLAWDGTETRAVRVLAATRVPEGAAPDRQNVGLTLDDVTLPAGFAGARRVDGLTLDAVLDLSAPLGLAALESGKIALERIEIARLDLDWGGVVLSADGALDVAPGGRLSGEVEVTLTHWRRALEIARTAGLLPAARRRMAEQALAALAAMSGRDDRLTATLALRDGAIWLGPVPLGPAPRL